MLPGPRLRCSAAAATSAVTLARVTALLQDELRVFLTEAICELAAEAALMAFNEHMRARLAARRALS